jgi:hypothetical protein
MRTGKTVRLLLKTAIRKTISAIFIRPLKGDRFQLDSV